MGLPPEVVRLGSCRWGLWYRRNRKRLLTIAATSLSWNTPWVN